MAVTSKTAGLANTAPKPKIRFGAMIPGTKSAIARIRRK
jgi:hypothetical protein